MIENPSMVRYGGSYWLFYSANEWCSAHYRAGIAKCSGPLGPCQRSRTTPLLPNTSRLAHQYWNAPYANYPTYSTCSPAGTCTTQGQRRMAVVPMRLAPTGHLVLG